MKLVNGHLRIVYYYWFSCLQKNINKLPESITKTHLILKTETIKLINPGLQGLAPKWKVTVTLMWVSPTIEQGPAIWSNHGPTWIIIITVFIMRLLPKDTKRQYQLSYVSEMVFFTSFEENLKEQRYQWKILKPHKGWTDTWHLNTEGAFGIPTVKTPKKKNSPSLLYSPRRCWVFWGMRPRGWGVRSCLCPASWGVTGRCSYSSSSSRPWCLRPSSAGGSKRLRARNDQHESLI